MLTNIDLNKEVPTLSQTSDSDKLSLF